MVEAARATTAAPLFFEPVTLEASGATFVDGAVRANNPIQHVVDEAERLWPKRPFGCVVSVGTGWKNVSPIATSRPRLHEILKTLTEIATDANTKAREFAKTKLGTQLQKGEKYFRFFVPQGLDGIDLANWERFPWMEAVTMPYLSDSTPNILTCGKNLVYPSSPSKSASISAPESILRLVNDNPDQHEEPSSMFPFPRNDGLVQRQALDQLAEILPMSETYQSAAIWGLGGCGWADFFARIEFSS